MFVADVIMPCPHPFRVFDADWQMFVTSLVTEGFFFLSETPSIKELPVLFILPTAPQSTTPGFLDNFEVFCTFPRILSWSKLWWSIMTGGLLEHTLSTMFSSQRHFHTSLPGTHISQVGYCSLEFIVSSLVPGTEFRQWIRKKLLCY